MIRPVFEPFTITAQETVAISLLISGAAAFARTIPAVGVAVKVRAFRIINLPTATVVRARVDAVIVAKLVGAQAVVIIRIVVL